MSLAGEQLALFTRDISRQASSDRTSTFVDNMKLPVHRWFRYSAGFSAEWVKQVVTEYQRQQAVTLFDPFAGSGTTLLAGQECGVECSGTEAHPFIVRVARAKLLWREDRERFFRFAERLLSRAKKQGGTSAEYPSLIYKCFPQDILIELNALKGAWLGAADGSPASELSWLALTAVLRSCSPVGTAQMELIQPRKRKQHFSRPFEAFPAQVSLMLQDMKLLQGTVGGARAIIHEDDARGCREIEDRSINLVITSPPYVNNYDYADATRLEMTFWGEVQGWGDLHQRVRRHLVRSCSQHMSLQRESLDQLLREAQRLPVRDELRRVCERLDEERLRHGGKKNYHLMVAAYFSDLAKVWEALRRICVPGGRACFVVGDSAPYGVYVPVPEWLGEVAVAAGFKSYSFEKTRDRNVKWKNRKHRVPLCEGRLWVEG
jgi:DNA modification methylase